MPWLDKDDFYYWNQGTHAKCYEKLGAHANRQGTWFAVWAPHAEAVSVIGEFNDWDAERHPLTRVEAGLWEAYVRGARPGQRYKYRIRRGRYLADKADPYAFYMEPPASDGSPIQGLSSVITDLDYDWNDTDWMNTRKGPDGLATPMSVYEVHLGSWKRTADGYSYGYREIAEPLADHVEKMGFTHVEFMPVAEHPYYASWGYQLVGYFAATNRYGSPQDLMYLIDYLHQRGIGVLLDWVPAHFATDPQGLVFFDGSTLYEYDDPLMRTHPDWGTYVFDFNKPGVRNFLVSNALFWLDKYHIDGLRVDAVASMIYRDYSRDEWRPNRYGGRENLEAIDLLKQTNETVYQHFPSAMTIAEESTAYPGVSAPTYDGGLGFLYKWNMGWMHDTLKFMGEDPINRKYHQDQLTFSFTYAFSEHYCLPLSHDEVVHGKGSLWGKMAGDSWQKAANLRLLYGHQFGHPGKKLLFMGSEFGQRSEWNHDWQIAWDLQDDPQHAGIERWVTALNDLYRSQPALWNDIHTGYAWIDGNKQENTLAYQRMDENEALFIVLNFTPVPRDNYRLGVPNEGTYRVLLNSDDPDFGGSDYTDIETLETTPVPYHGRPASLVLPLPPLGMMILKQVRSEASIQKKSGEG